MTGWDWFQKKAGPSLTIWQFQNSKTKGRKQSTEIKYWVETIQCMDRQIYFWYCLQKSQCGV